MKKQAFQHNRVFILIAHGFDEKPVLDCLHHMRDVGVAASLVSLTPGVIKGLHGLKLHSDILIDQLPQTTQPLLVLIPGGTQCATVLMADPRAYQLITRTLESQGFVATMLEAQSVVQEAGFPVSNTASQFFVQGQLGTKEFVNRLVDLSIPDN